MKRGMHIVKEPEKALIKKGDIWFSQVIIRGNFEVKNIPNYEKHCTCIYNDGCDTSFKVVSLEYFS